MTAAVAQPFIQWVKPKAPTPRSLLCLLAGFALQSGSITHFVEDFFMRFHAASCLNWSTPACRAAKQGGDHAPPLLRQVAQMRSRYLSPQAVRAAAG